MPALDGLAVDFRALFESAPGLYLVLDPDLRIVAATDAYLSATMTIRDEIVGRDLFAVFPDNPDSPEVTGTAVLRRSLRLVAERHQPDLMAVQQYDVARPDGTFEVRHWSPRNSPVLGPDGHLRYLLHQVVDVTEYVALQHQGSERVQQMEAEILRHSSEMREANTALRAADQAKNDFLSRVSHELRTPLNAILGFSELLALDEMAGEHREWVGLINQSGRRLLALIDDILDIARISGGDLTLPAGANAGDEPAPPAAPGPARPARVLLVEDIAENARLVRDILVHRPAVTIEHAALARTALELALAHPPDLILLDLHLPDMPGEDLLSLLRAEHTTCDIPVVVLSADATARHIAELRAAGVAAYLTKPVAVRDLLGTVDRLLSVAGSSPG